MPRSKLISLTATGPAWQHLPAREAFQAVLAGLPPARLEKQQHDLAGLFYRRAQRYSLGHTSSLPRETAGTLWRSVLYTLGVGLKARAETAPAAAEALEAHGAAALHSEGIALLEQKRDTAKRLLRAARNAPPPLPHQYYSETLDPNPLSGGIAAFFHLYDLYYAAADTPEINDYPLCFMPRREEGIEYLLVFLEHLLLENRFLRRFEAGALHEALATAEPDYAALPFGMFQPVLHAALGCVLAGTDPLLLEAAPLPSDIWHRDIPAALQDAAGDLCAALTLPHGDPLATYVHAAAREAVPFFVTLRP